MDECIRVENTAAIDALRHLEEDTHYACGDYLCSSNICQRNRDGRHGTTSCGAVSSSNREEMVEWTYRVVDFLKFSHETVAIAVSILDRFLLTNDGSHVLQSGLQFKLATMTCLYLSAKLHEHVVLSSQLMARLSQGIYTQKQVEDMELVVLTAMEWHISPPTALAFVREFLNMLPEDSLPQDTKATAYDLCKAQTEKAVIDYNFVTVKASTVAFFSVMNALKGMGMDSILLDRAGSLISCATHTDYTDENDENVGECLFQAIENYSSIQVKPMTNTNHRPPKRQSPTRKPTPTTSPNNRVHLRHESPCSIFVDVE